MATDIRPRTNVPQSHQFQRLVCLRPASLGTCNKMFSPSKKFPSHRTQRCLCTVSSRTVSGAATVLLGPRQLGARQRTAERTMGDGVSLQSWKDLSLLYSLYTQD